MATASGSSSPTTLVPVPKIGEAENEDPHPPPKVLPLGMVSLVKTLSKRLEATWRGTGTTEEINWSEAIYDTEYHLRRRPPNEIEAVLRTLDETALLIIEQSFGNRIPDLHEFAQAVVRTGTYDADGVLGFIGGVVDLFLEVLWSQADKAYGAPERQVRWGQLMNHFIESPEIAMFEGTEITAGLGGKTRGSGDRMPQMEKSDTVDCAKHLGSNIEKTYWLQHLESFVTVEGTESVYFWSPNELIDAPKCIQTPELQEKHQKEVEVPKDPNLKSYVNPKGVSREKKTMMIWEKKEVPDCYDKDDKPLYSVLAVAWDGSQDLVALLSNRLLVCWRLRSREKFQFRQRVMYRLHACKTNESRHTRGDSPWKVRLTVEERVLVTGESAEPKPSSAAGSGSRTGSRGSTARPQQVASATEAFEREERNMRLQMKEDRDAKDVANQLDIWYNTQIKLWVTTDTNGKLCFWDLISLEGTPEQGPFEPKHECAFHKRKVTAYVELGLRKFVTGSLDRTIVLWDTINLSPEHKIEDHTASVLGLAYLSNFYSLISIGCEKRVYVWSIDSTAYRGLTAKLSGHQANLVQVTSGNDQRGRAFFTLDEAFVVIVWDVGTLSSLQTFNTSKQRPRHCLAFSNTGRLCLAGRRFYFYEGNELMALNYMGAIPSKEQLAKAKKPVAGSFKERAKPRWCGLNAARGTMISVSEAEVRVHTRGNPAQSRVTFCLNEGETVTSYATMDSKHLAILGTSKGAIYFLKCRSGCTLKHYQGRLDGEAWEPGANAPTGGAPAIADVGPESTKAQAIPSGPRLSGSSPAHNSFPPSPVVNAGGGNLSAQGSVTDSPGHAKSAKSGGSFVPVRGGAITTDTARDTEKELAGSGRPSDILLGIDMSNDAASDARVEEEELSQELHEVREITRMGYLEADARRALQQRRKFQDALREWQNDEEAQQAFKNADAELQKKTLEELRSGNINANIENAVEKLLSGAVATTSVEELPARLPIRVMESVKENEEEKVRPRREKSEHNAPSPEEIAKGLSRKIQCILTLEEQDRVYIGTDEGQVLTCACDENFTILRWVTPPGPNAAAVTCLDALYEERFDGPFGLLLVGTQDGSAHLYGLPNLRLAGSINIGRIIPEANPETGDLQLRHVRLLRMPQDSSICLQFPFAVLTVDRRSRFRFWGIRIHAQSGKLEELALLLDGGQLQEIKEELDDPDATTVEARGAKPKTINDQMRSFARVTTVCSLRGPVVLPLSAVPGALAPGVRSQDAPASPPQSAAFAALAAAFAAGNDKDEKDNGEPSEKEKGKVTFEEEKDAGDDESSGTENDGRPETVELTRQRQKARPLTPKNGIDVGDVPKPPSVAVAEGANYIFFGDAVGRIWCLNAVGSAVAAHEERPLLTVLLDENDSSSPKARAKSGLRFNTTGSGSHRNLASSHGGDTGRSVTALASKQAIPAPAPEALKIATSWQAHEGYIISLVPTTSPPALVSTDGDKHVRVWSTAGDLWGHFQLAGVEPGNTFIWPPPHVIAAQHALMNVAKGLCKKMGLSSGGHDEDTNKKKRRSFLKKSMKGIKDKDGATSAAADKKVAKKVVVKSTNEPEVPKKERKPYPRKKRGNATPSDGEGTAFMTETRTSPTTTPTASESETGGGTTADEISEAPPSQKLAFSKPSVVAKPLSVIKQEAPIEKEREMTDENLFDDDDDMLLGGDEAAEEDPSRRLVATKTFATTLHEHDLEIKRCDVNGYQCRRTTTSYRCGYCEHNPKDKSVSRESTKHRCDWAVCDVCYAKAHQFNTTLLTMHEHPLVEKKKGQKTCDVKGEGCRKVGTTYKCAYGCDWAVCDICCPKAAGNTTLPTLHEYPLVPTPKPPPGSHADLAKLNRHQKFCDVKGPDCRKRLYFVIPNGPDAGKPCGPHYTCSEDNDWSVCDLCYGKYIATPLHEVGGVKHPLAQKSCDVQGPGCKGTATTYRCACGCDFICCDVCYAKADGMTTTLHDHPVIYNAKPQRACDVKLDSQCRKIGTSYMCGMGCDWGVCEPCYQKAVQRAQFNDMVKEHGFSGGFKSFRHLQSRVENSGKKAAVPESPTNNRRKGDSLAELNKQRTNFFGREAADFGVLLETRKDTDDWSQSTRNMGPRSCSEGALLRYAKAAVQDMTRTVYNDMGVDVTKTDMKELRKPSFIAALDVRLRTEVPPEFVRDSSSPTVQKMLGQKTSSDAMGGMNRSSSAPRRLTALQGAGSSMVGSGKSKLK